MTAEELIAWWWSVPDGDQFFGPGGVRYVKPTSTWIVSPDHGCLLTVEPDDDVHAFPLAEIYTWVRLTEGHGWADDP